MIYHSVLPTSIMIGLLDAWGVGGVSVEPLAAWGVSGVSVEPIDASGAATVSAAFDTYGPGAWDGC